MHGGKQHDWQPPLIHGRLDTINVTLGKEGKNTSSSLPHLTLHGEKKKQACLHESQTRLTTLGFRFCSCRR